MSEAMSLTNLIGNSVATIVAAKWENELDEAQMNAALNTTDIWEQNHGN
jgi:aerobic C4-dicarboxylate transport protein